MWKFQMYLDAGNEYRWRLCAPNGQTIASSGESFSSKSNAKRAAENVRARIGAAVIEEL